ncbi:hypothetical protein MKL09_25160 [Methylobacterium sp. J-048]|uniref:hypothetical protein n=1 Tax=Methylobacterium sp. J-048 TaxID=2836635 RepID=UPI001FBA4853|nr:hypothetical protein [Methylobacterium sp. J-048]MCJ2059806.1 hypothetical protein [Methylobacterium sp. J-048]
MTGFLQLATVDGQRVGSAAVGMPSPPVPAETMRFLCEMRCLEGYLREASDAAALLANECGENPAVAEGLALKVSRDLSLARKVNLEAQRLVPHLIGLVLVEVEPSNP